MTRPSDHDDPAARKYAYAMLDVALTALHVAHRLLPPGPALESVRAAEEAVALADKAMRRKPTKRTVRKT